MKELCVVHLVRAQNGIEPFRRFLESYREKPGGIEHDLLIAFKGFKRPQDTTEYRELLESFRYTSLDISDKGFDITAYFAAVNRYSEHYRYFCFLNSYSVILDRDWLRKLHENITKPGVALSGATGSWNSNCTNAYAWFCDRTRSICDLLYKNKRTVITTETEKNLHEEISCWEKVILTFKGAWVNFRLLIYFEPFPNYHIRTNAFMISGKLMKTLECPSMKTKMDAYRFESGKKGLTRQILNMSKRVVVVGRDGKSYEKEDWRESRTFWQSEQENLLVADNQTRDYQEGSPERRNKLHFITWGNVFRESNDG